jgi:sporulation protein YlmC with PRC-barrel domain
VAARHINIELLLSRRVYAINGKCIGRLEEVRAEMRDGECVLTEFLIGVYALFERLAGGSIGRSILQTLRLKRKNGGYRVPWNQLDLSNPARPRLKCPLHELLPIIED